MLRFSAIQADAIAESIPCVVGMTRAVRMRRPSHLPLGSMRRSRLERSVAEAFELGLTQVELTDPRLIGNR